MIKRFTPFGQVTKLLNHFGKCSSKKVFERSVLWNIVFSNNFTSFTRSSCVNMSKFRFTDYDCIGFDMDNTLLRYNITNLVHLEYDILAKYLVNKKGYSPKYLLKPLEDEDFDFMQKGLYIDFERGNILRISPDGTIQRAAHGTRLLDVQGIREIYRDQRWEVIDIFCKDMLATWNGPLSMKMRALLDYFDVPSSLIFARLVDTLDEEQGKPLNAYHIWPDMLDGMIDMYSRERFQSDEGNFFPTFKEYPERFLHKCNAKTISWLRDVKKNSLTFLITGSNADFADFIATYALGKNWKSLFDIVICYAKKPGFFTLDRPFLQIENFKEGKNVQCKDMELGKMYSQGNWKELVEFFARVSNKKNPSCLYIGDNLLQDIYVPNAYVHCDTIAVIEEQMSEGMIYQGLSHPDEKILNSKFWGSYFSLKDSRNNIDSSWGYVIKKYSKLCIPSIEVLVNQPLTELYPCFQKDGKTYCGYYPATPLSISGLSKE